MRDGSVYARGSADDKGQFLANVLGVEAWLQANGSAPVNIKFLIEGEEEIGSVSLPPFIAAHKARLAADACVWEFGDVNSQGAPIQTQVVTVHLVHQPAITYLPMTQR